MRSALLELPAEIRVNILEHLLQRPLWHTISRPNTQAARDRGYTDGVGHVTLVRERDEWRSVSVARPPGLTILCPAILRTCRLLHKEAMGLLYSKCLFVLNIQNMRPAALPFINGQPAIVAGPTKASMFLRWINHVHIRQHITPEEDLSQKAQSLDSLIRCLSPDRKTTGLTLHFDSMWLVNDGEWPQKARPEYVWQLFGAELARMPIGNQPQIRVSSHWLELEGKERFDDLASKLGGYVRLALNLIIPS
ncbi:hypothetical protein PRZ48_009841 [Zasmidium cellare]|uniref:F-box domain-containing protein n=1 Tax=Zasmidium cellare TaxID=395010 RepID=A0ABR0EE37_ZASCE|nr:hypothetical protein PRZ48_009841 [Zasmidium cellare]